MSGTETYLSQNMRTLHPQLIPNMMQSPRRLRPLLIARAIMAVHARQRPDDKHSRQHPQWAIIPIQKPGQVRGCAQVLPRLPVPAEVVRHAGCDVADHHLADAPRRLVLGGRPVVERRAHPRRATDNDAGEDEAAHARLVLRPKKTHKFYRGDVLLQQTVISLVRERAGLSLQDRPRSLQASVRVLRLEEGHSGPLRQRVNCKDS